MDAIDLLGNIVLALLAISAAAMLEPRLGVAAPLLLIAAGIGVSFLPGAPEIHVEPEWIITGVLTPLLYSASVSMPTVHFRRDRRPLDGGLAGPREPAVGRGNGPQRGGPQTPVGARARTRAVAPRPRRGPWRRQTPVRVCGRPASWRVLQKRRAPPSKCRTGSHFDPRSSTCSERLPRRRADRRPSIDNQTARQTDASDEEDASRG